MTQGLDSTEEPPGGTPGRRRFKLTSLRAVRREMAAVYRDARERTIDPADGTKLTYMLAAVAKVLESSDLEARVKALEERAPSVQSGGRHAA